MRRCRMLKTINIYKVLFGNGFVKTIFAKTDQQAKAQAYKLWSYGAGFIEIENEKNELFTIRRTKADGYLKAKWENRG